MFELITNLRRSFDMKEMLGYSYTNFHAIGVDYLCLFRSNRFTVKLYHFNENYTPNEEGWAVNPHDHAYEFKTYVLSGHVKNVLFYEKPVKYETPNEFRWYKFKYKSPLNGGNGFTFENPVYLEQYCIGLFERGEEYYLNTLQIHTIIPVVGTSLIIYQYHDMKQVTNYYSKSCEPPDTKNLYSKMDEEKAKYMLGLI